MLIKPILEACAAFDAGTLTATIIGVTIIKLKKNSPILFDIDGFEKWKEKQVKGGSYE